MHQGGQSKTYRDGRECKAVIYAIQRLARVLKEKPMPISATVQTKNVPSWIPMGKRGKTLT